MEQVCSAFVYIHQQGIIHRNLRPENILLKWNEQGTVKIIDIGLSGFTAKQKIGKFKEIPYYAAPETL